MGISSKQKFTLGLDNDTEILFAHLYDLAQQHDKYSQIRYSDFLSENSQSELLKRKNLLPCAITLSGGYEDAERKMAAFADEGQKTDFPFSSVLINYPRFKTLTHRDFLGSIMALGIKREKVGDIIVGDGFCSVIVHSDIAMVISDRLNLVGKVGVSASLQEISDINIPSKSFKEINGTVKSLRLDAVLSMLLCTGRGNASDWISCGRVFVNGICAVKADMRLSDGDVLSVRGKGKAVLNVGGISKKDRIFITLNKYV